MALTGVLRPGHIQIRVLDLSKAVRHYTETIGLTEVDRDSNGLVYLKAWDEHDRHSVILRESDQAGMDFMSFRVRDETTLDALALALERSPLIHQSSWFEAGSMPGTGRRFQFVIPTGHTIELFAHKDKNGCATGDLNPDPWPDNLHGMAPSRFDHCLLFGDDVDGTLTVFRDILGFELSEQVIGGPDGKTRVGIFLTCSNKAHDVAFIRYPEKNKLHHVSFFLEDWNEVLHAADLISKRDVSLDLGPTRHGITRGKTIYFFDPSGNRNEVFAGGYGYYPDRPVITWNESQLGKGIFYHNRTLNQAFLSVVT